MCYSINGNSWVNWSSQYGVRSSVGVRLKFDRMFNYSALKIVISFRFTPTAVFCTKTEKPTVTATIIPHNQVTFEPNTTFPFEIFI